MANEYKVNELNVEVVMTPQSSDARVYALCVEVVRSIADAPAATWKPKIVMVA